jgi:DNA helicase HerA-like ATPase
VADKIGVVGSPSTTGRVTVDIVDDASNMPLHGQLVYLLHPLTGNALIALGTVAEINTQNRWHEDANMRGVLKKHGSLPHLSEVGDVRTAELLIQAAYETEDEDPAKGEPPLESGGALSMSPTTGAPVFQVTDDFLRNLLRRHTLELTYLGHIHRSEVKLPLKLRHFGLEKDGGIGEAYHLGVFGMTGSGKTVLSAYLIAAYLRHETMGVIVMDPQGQFTSGSKLPFSLTDWAKEQGREVQKFSISNDLRLQRDAPLLGDLLGITPFFKDVLSIKSGEWRESAVREFARKLQGIDKWDEGDPGSVLKDVLTSLADDEQATRRIYATKDARERLVGQMKGIIEDKNELKIALDLFKPLHNLFAPKNLNGAKRVPLWPILQRAVEIKKARPLVIFDFSAQGESWLSSTPVKARLLRLVCSRLNAVAEERYQNEETLNTLVVFDEAQRFAAQDPEDEQSKELSIRLVDYVRTTRKYGLGWMFITQETGALRTGIWRQLRVRALGHGLTSGGELSRLKDLVPDQSALDLYRSFVDPGAIEPSQYPFMITGPVSPLSFTGAPVFLSVYTDFGAFREANGIDAAPADEQAPSSQ